MGYGSKLREILQKQNLTVKELSDKTGIPATTLYSLINRDSSKIDTDTLIKICDVLDTDDAYILLENSSGNKYLYNFLLKYYSSLIHNNLANENINITSDDSNLYNQLLQYFKENINTSKIDLSYLSKDDIQELQNYADYLRYKRNQPPKTKPSTTE